jgi:broad specificity phosphatase PhoE
MLEILFIRHGQTDLNLAQRVIGRQPVSLNELGRRQAKELSECLKGVELNAVISSPVLRAKQTAEAIIEGHPELELVLEEGFSEIDYGEWVGLTITEVVTRYPDVWPDYHSDPKVVKIPGGESLVAARDRTLKAFMDIKRRYPEGRIAIVSHADVIKLAITAVMDWPIELFKSFSMDNGAIALIRENPALGMRMVLYNPMNGLCGDTKDGQ